MAARDADELDCDFAEIYGIIDRRSVPPAKAAVLAGGLFSCERGTRIRRKYSGAKLSLTEWLLAGIADSARLLVWFKTKDGQKNRNRPESILAKLIDGPDEEQSEVFETAEEFEAERARRGAARAVSC